MNLEYYWNGLDGLYALASTEVVFCVKAYQSGRPKDHLAWLVVKYGIIVLVGNIFLFVAIISINLHWCRAPDFFYSLHSEENASLTIWYFHPGELVATHITNYLFRRIKRFLFKEQHAGIWLLEIQVLFRTCLLKTIWVSMIQVPPQVTIF